MEWQEARTPEEISNFMKRHDFVSFAENQILNEKKENSADPEVSYGLLLNEFRSKPWSIFSLIQKKMHLLKTVIDRPFLSLSILLPSILNLLSPLLIAYLILIFFYLWEWAHVISKDFPSLFKKKSIFRAFMLLSLLLSLYLKELLFFSLVFSSFAWLYSRRPLLPAIFLLSLSSLWILSPFHQILIKTAEETSALEALHEGRTRLEWSPDALKALSPAEAAIWSELNGDRSSARAWLSRAENGREKSLLEALFNTLDGGALKGLKDFEILQAQFPNDPVLLYNLTQLYTRTQNLVAADQSRAKLGDADLRILGTSDLAFPLGRSALTAFMTHFQKNLRDYWNAYLKTKAALSYWLLHFILPLLLIYWAVKNRPRVSGLCQYTGETTPQIFSHESQLYQTMKVKSSNRQEVERSVRVYQRHRHQMAQFWTWLIPNFDDFVRGESFGLPFFKMSLWLILGVLCLSVSAREQVLACWGFVFSNSWMTSNPSLSLGVMALICFGVWIPFSYRGLQA